MITINICGIEQVFDSYISSWIKDQFYNRKKVGADFWFIIRINTNGIKVTLLSVGAPQSGGKPYSEFNNKEKRIIDMWKEMNVEKIDNIDSLLIFLSRVKQDIN